MPSFTNEGRVHVGAAVSLILFGSHVPETLGQATDVDGAHAAVAAQYTFDNNLYRLPSLPDSALLRPNASREDHITTVSAAGNGQWTLGRQQFLADMKIANNRFVRNSELNNNSGSYRITWNWTVSPFVTGDAGAEFNRALAGFANERFLGRDLLQTTGYFGDLRFRVANHWQLVAGVKGSHLTHSLDARRGENFRSNSGNAAVRYYTSEQDYLALDYRYTNYRFAQPTSFNGLPFDPDCNDSTETLQVKHALTGKTSVYASVGYLKRHYLHDSSGSFAGQIWHAKLLWQASGKTHVDLETWRDLTANLEAQSDYFVSRGGSISPVWDPTTRISLSLLASWSSQEYLGASPSAIQFTRRHDNRVTQQLNLRYRPRDALTLTLSYQHEYRDSNIPVLAYNDRTGSADIQLSF